MTSLSELTADHSKLLYEIALQLRDKPFLLNKVQESAALMKEVVESLQREIDV